MELADKWKRHEIFVDNDMVDFVKVPSNLKQFFHSGIIQGILLDVVLVFLRIGPSVYENS
jgi:hypothetical protein